MIDDVVIEPMTKDFVLWRCLHDGPLSSDTIDQWPPASKMPWDRYRQRNSRLLTKLTETYGACAIIARDGDKIVGHLRFYPKAICGPGCAGCCLQQDAPAGPADDASDKDFPAPERLDDRTLLVHCLMTGSSLQKTNPYQRKGIGTRLVRTLIEWAQANGWERIEADAFEDLPIVYGITGSAGLAFWEKLGFRVVDRHPHPALQKRDEFVMTLEEQAKSHGIPPERARDRIVMCLDLT